MERILGGIYVGSSQPVIVGMDLKGKYNITHVLSIIKGPLPESLSKNYTVKQIQVNDEENENIMDFFKEANQFINSALFPLEENNSTNHDDGKTAKQKNTHKGAILIHCSEGISRSVAFTIAYLMYRYKLSLQHSLYAVQRKREGAQPNTGFMNQLRIYEEALQHNDYQFEIIDLEAEKGYRDWVFKNQMEDEDIRNKFLANDNVYTDILDKNTMSKDEKLTQLRCKKCRQPLALSTAFIPHERPDQGSRHANFITTSAYSNRILNIEKASDFCSHIFVEPLNWMKEELHKGELLGKFYCPNSRCGTKVGAYSWKGARCSCGRWVVPALSLQTAKVDEAFISEHTNFEQIKREKH